MQSMQVASALAYPGSSRLGAACSMRRAALVSLSGVVRRADLQLDVLRRQPLSRASVLSCACRRAARVAMR
eukprot:3385653-Prymnesium_polylepis.1